jgi:hypothetical protein
VARGGKREGAGRPKGSINRSTVAKRALYQRATAEGITPLEVIITAMRDAWDAGNVEEAVQHAVHAAPYVHPRLASTQVKVDDQRSIEQYTDAELELVVRASRARAVAAEASEAEPDPVH